LAGFFLAAAFLAGFFFAAAFLAGFFFATAFLAFFSSAAGISAGSEAGIAGRLCSGVTSSGARSLTASSSDANSSEHAPWQHSSWLARASIPAMNDAHGFFGSGAAPSLALAPAFSRCSDSFCGFQFTAVTPLRRKELEVPALRRSRRRPFS
jgi:hypothetical protein